MAQQELLRVKGIGPASADRLVSNSIATVKTLAGTNVLRIMAVTGFGEKRSAAIRQSAAELSRQSIKPTPKSDTRKAGSTDLQPDPVQKKAAAAKEDGKKTGKGKKKKKKGKKERTAADRAKKPGKKKKGKKKGKKSKKSKKSKKKGKKSKN